MSQKKFQKKKDRERAVRKKILAERERRTKPEDTPAEESSFKPATGFKRFTRPRRGGFTIRNDEMRQAEEAHKLQVQMQLEHNMQILKALEEEYQEELKKRQDYMEEVKQSSLVEKATEVIERNAETVISQAQEKK